MAGVEAMLFGKPDPIPIDASALSLRRMSQLQTRRTRKSASPIKVK